MKSEPDLFKGELSMAPAVGATIVEMGPDGQLINQADKKRRVTGGRSNQWVPWTVAAIALFGWGVSVTLDRRPPVVTKAPEPVASETVGAAAVAEQADAERPEEPAADELDQPEAKADEAVTPDQTAAVSAGASDSFGSTAPLKSEKLDAAEQAEPPAEAATSAAATSASKSAALEPSSETEEGAEEGVEEPVLSPFSSAIAASAMREATALAGACRKTGDPTGYATVVVTFAPSGRVTQAAVTGAPFAGTETGGCIASRFRTARVPAFSGQHVTVKKTVTIQ
jgi:hypothetical protein